MKYGQGVAVSNNKESALVRFWPHTNDANVASYRLRCRLIVEGLQGQLDVGIYQEDMAKVDVLVLSKRYDAQSIAHAKKLQAVYGTMVVLDICDNYFFYDEANADSLEKAKQLKSAIASVDILIASSAFLAAQIKTHCGDHIRISVIGDLVEAPSFPSFPSIAERLRSWYFILSLILLRCRLKVLGNAKCFRLVWFGVHAGSYRDSGMRDLLKVKDVIEKLAKRYPVSLTVVSNSRAKYGEVMSQWSVPTFYVPWNIYLFSSTLMLHGLSIIPITKNNFSMAKTSNRVGTSLIHDLGVVADEIPSYREYEDHVYLNNWEGNLIESFSSNRVKLTPEYFVQRNNEILALWKLSLEKKRSSNS